MTFPMKIICIGRNYVDHARELSNEVPEAPVFFMKPETALVTSNQPFIYPSFSSEVHHEIEVVIRINRSGKEVAEEEAHQYFDEIGLGVDFTARDLQSAMKKKGLPWEIAKAFDYSAPVSDFYPKSAYQDIHQLAFRLDRNGSTVQEGNTSLMIFSFERIIAYVSRFITLKQGDLLFTGTPAGVGPVKQNDRLEAYLDETKVLDFQVE
jgi:2-keto-4-pentenoate hydratase/2-oxohepta-3-ene-1,7-dioic acid hydratase in catechol pathway